MDQSREDQPGGGREERVHFHPEGQLIRSPICQKPKAFRILALTGPFKAELPGRPKVLRVNLQAIVRGILGILGDQGAKAHI